MLTNLSPNQLRLAADLKEKIDGLHKQLASIIFVGGKTHTPVKVLALAKAVKPAKGGMSAAGKASQSAKMKAYWAAKKAAKTTAIKVVPNTKPAAPKPAKKKFVMSAEAKAKISAAAKARWAAKKAGQVKK